MIAPDRLQERLDAAYSAAAAHVLAVTRITLDHNNSPHNPYHPDNPYDIAAMQQHNTLRPSSSALTPVHSLHTYNANNLNNNATGNCDQVNNMYDSSGTLFSSGGRKFSSSYQLSELTDSIFGLGSHGLAHSYSLASFDLATDADEDLPSMLRKQSVPTTSVTKVQYDSSKR